jgi:hypothetical protein
MNQNTARELAALERMTVGQLQQRYAEVFGEMPRSRHRQYLVRRVAWRLQANAEGALTDRALRRAAELADVGDARVTPPRERPNDAPAPAETPTRPSDPRLPPVGGAITRRYRGRTLTVTVRGDGFEFDGERFKSLSAVAKAITGSHLNGFRFFQIEGKP